MLHRFVGALVSGLTLAVSPVAFGAELALKPAPASAGLTVTLGDLFEGAGAAAPVRVASASRPGQALVLDAALVQRTAAGAGLSWSNPTGLRRIAVVAGAPAAPAVGAAVSAPAAAATARGVEVLTYARSLAAGEMVAPEDVVFAKVAYAPADALLDSDRVVGLAARRALRAGSPVAAKDLSAPQVIRKDDVVVVSFARDGVSLSLQAKAIAGAAAGERVALVNPVSKKIIEAVAVGPGEAEAGVAPRVPSSSPAFASLR